MNETVDGEYQAMKARDGAYVREKFFGKYPETEKLVSSLSDKDIWRLNRGGHDPHKVFAAYDKAIKHQGSPTVILAKTINGYGMGKSGESVNTTHQTKKLDVDDLMYYRDRFDVPLTDEQVRNIEYFRPDEKSPEIKYLKEKRIKLGGYLPERSTFAKPIKAPSKDIFDFMKVSTGEKEMSTTMALVRMLTALLRDKNVSPRLVPIIPDEARTFGLDPLFRQLGIYAHKGQLYEPVDSDQFLYYKEAVNGQIFEEGINEAGAISSFIAAGMSYQTTGENMIPFYIYYSMFGFQRVWDFIWAAGDMRARGFLLGGTAGRTTLNGEGLQHQDGHSHLAAAVTPNIKAYDLAYAYEIAVVVRYGIKEMFFDQKDVIYYLTLENENYVHPPMPNGVEEDIIKGMYKLHSTKEPKIRLLGSGPLLNEVIEAAKILKEDWSIDPGIWNVTSFTELRREAEEVERWNIINPNKEAKRSHIEKSLNNNSVPTIAVSDYVKMSSEQISPYVSGSFYSLGTDGFGRSDTRENLRHFFEVDRYYIVLTAMRALADQGDIEMKVVNEVIKKYNIDPNKPSPIKV